MDDLSALLPLGLAFLAADGSSDYAALKGQLRQFAKKDPIDALMVTALGGGLAFYMAERGKNPAIEGPWDAILYVATCFSVGYDNAFPMTPAGHALATMVQSFGPALAGMALDEPAADKQPDESLEVNRQILARLDDIVRLLEVQRA
jgi:hypothetical protein|nr:hypothetical protein [Kofleriaceae bacterium]